MEPQGSLLHSQVPATCLYPEPARSSLYPHLLKIHLITHPSTSGSPQWPLFPHLPHQNPLHAIHLPIRATCPTHLILDFITRTILGEEYITLSSSLCSFLHCTVISSFLGPNTLLNTLFSLTHKTHTTSLPECCEVRKRSIVMAFQLEVCGYKDEACW